MNEYTFENIIIDPSSKEAKSNLNKKVYIGLGVASLLKNANSDSEKATLVSINPESDTPFVVKKDGEIEEVSCSAIIPCKEMEMIVNLFTFGMNFWIELQNLPMNTVRTA